MKQFKRTPYFLVSGIFLFLSCQTEEIPVTENRQKQTRQVTKVSFSTFKKQTGLVDFKTTFEIPKSSNGAILQRKNNGYTPADFIIDTKEITQTIAGEKTSYVFPITPVKGEIEDKRFYLVVYNKDGKWLEMIIQADYSVDKDGDVSQSGFKEIYASSARGLGCTIIYSWVLKCNGKGECAGGVCDKCSICLRGFADRICPPINKQDYYDGGFTKPDGNGGGGGGGSSNPNPNPETNPNPDPDPEVIIELPLPHPRDSEPCKELKKLSESNHYAPTIRYLKGKADGGIEFGWAFKYFENNTTFESPRVMESDPRDRTKLDFSNFRGIEWLGAFHNHTEPTSTRAVQMFSPGDVEWLLLKGSKIHLATIRNTPHPNFSELFVGLVVKDGVYVLKIKNWTKFSRLINNSVFEDFKEKLKDLNRIDTPDASKEKHEITFLKMLTEFDLGVGLYEQDEQGKWNELILDPQNRDNAPKKVTCN